VKAGARLGLFCAALILPAPAFGQSDTGAKSSNRARAWDVAGTVEIRPDSQMQSETIIAAGPRALRNAVWRIGAGIDF
jgi:hypothetical protein